MVKNRNITVLIEIDIVIHLLMPRDDVRKLHDENNQIICDCEREPYRINGLRARHKWWK